MGAAAGKYQGTPKQRALNSTAVSAAAVAPAAAAESSSRASTAQSSARWQAAMLRALTRCQTAAFNWSVYSKF